MCEKGHQHDQRKRYVSVPWRGKGGSWSKPSKNSSKVKRSAVFFRWILLHMSVICLPAIANNKSEFSMFASSVCFWSNAADKDERPLLVDIDAHSKVVPKQTLFFHIKNVPVLLKSANFWQQRSSLLITIIAKEAAGIRHCWSNLQLKAGGLSVSSIVF